MAIIVPERPTTHELQTKYPQTLNERARILEKRARVSKQLGGYSTRLLIVLGMCGPTRDALDVVAREAAQLANHEALCRMPDWKPRTDPKMWSGLLPTDPVAAYRLLHDTAQKHANVAIEVSTDPRHLERNAPFVTLAWKGGRNHTEPELTDRLALYDPTIPVAVKNGLDGEVDSALRDVERIEELRHGMGARAILLWRGGLNAKTPEAWEEQYLHIHELTEGRFIVDLAHGGEQAHDPHGKFGKSIDGQRDCMDHLIEIVEHTGKTPVGIFAEASDHKGRTDPNMPFDQALERALRLAELKQSLTDHELTKV